MSYLGREEFAPAGARQAVLQERFGFSCSCARCQLEQRAPQQLQRSLEHVYATVMKVRNISASLMVEVVCLEVGIPGGNLCSGVLVVQHASVASTGECVVAAATAAAHMHLLVISTSPQSHHTSCNALPDHHF